MTVLLDEDDLACAAAGLPEALDGELLAFDPDLHVVLKQRGLPHATPWDFVGADDGPALRGLERDVWRFWQEHAHATYRGFDLLRMAPFRHMEVFSRLAWAAYVLERALQRLRPAEVVVFEERCGHGLSQPPENRKYPVLFALLRGLAEQAGARTRVLSRRAIVCVGGFKDLAAAGSEPADLPPAIVDRDLGDRPYVLFYGNHVDLAHQLPLIRALRERNNCAVAQLYKAADEPTLRSMHQAGHVVWHESQVAEGAPLTEDRPWQHAARAAFDAARSTSPPALRSIFSNPHLDIHFDFIFGAYLRKLAWHVDVWTRFFSAHRPALLVLSDRVPLGEVAAQLGIQCLTLSHGLLIGEGRWTRSLLPRIGALSESHRSSLLEAGMPAGDVCVTGSPALDRLAVSLPRASGDGGQANVRVRQRLGIAADRHVVLCCTCDLGTLSKLGGLPRVNWARAVQCVEELGALAARRPEWTFLFKCHPRFDHPRLYEQLRSGSPAAGDVRVVVDAPIDALASAADAVVLPNGLSSTLIEASFWRTPVVVLTPSLLWYDARSWGTERWCHLGSLRALEAELEQMFADPRRRERRCDQTRAALRHYLGRAPTRSVPRCLRLVDAALASAAAAPCAAGPRSRARRTSEGPAAPPILPNTVHPKESARV